MPKTVTQKNLASYIRDIPDFPKKGIIFKDITTLLKDKTAFKKVIDLLAKKYKTAGVDYVVAVESRGFIFGAPLAYKLGAGFILIRKKGKLPYKTKSVTYDLEYGTDTLEIHEDALKAGSKVLIVDDLLATGGTIKAVVDLVKQQKVKVLGLAFVVELGFLNGRAKLKGLPVEALIKY
ncbi:MAG: adenine phosphoribosyltransferase [Candidatus Omnitrophica bacterium]|nr:adenine phosphoribosyltransferase [Candidatus Omnitrophota bacterium]